MPGRVARLTACDGCPKPRVAKGKVAGPKVETDAPHRRGRRLNRCKMRHGRCEMRHLLTLVEESANRQPAAGTSRKCWTENLEPTTLESAEGASRLSLRAPRPPRPRR